MEHKSISPTQCATPAPKFLELRIKMAHHGFTVKDKRQTPETHMESDNLFGLFKRLFSIFRLRFAIFCSSPTVSVASFLWWALVGCGRLTWVSSTWPRAQRPLLKAIDHRISRPNLCINLAVFGSKDPVVYAGPRYLPYHPRRRFGPI